MASHANGSSRRNDSSKSSRSDQTTDRGYLAGSRINALNKTGSISGTDSPSDSLVDLYSTGMGKSTTNSVDHGERGREVKNGALYDEDDPGWIHRDKLARIESQELQAAGIILPRTRAYSKAGRKDRSREPSVTGLGRIEQQGQQQKRQKIESQPEEEQEIEESQEWDLRSPEEIAADNNAVYRDYGSLSKGASKIPLSLTSPLPIPLEYIERDAPMQRSRSTIWSEESIAYPLQDNQTAKAPSEEPPVLQKPPAPKRHASADISPKKAVTPAVRKASGPNAKTPPVTVSRPKTRSGSNSRPATRSGENAAKKPEGDPPWLATMYKPDPRLPPDQQMLPTVAKRLQQEQWEKEGKFGNAYDRELRPLNDEEIQQPEIVQQVVNAPALKPEGQGEWPLRTPKSPEPNPTRPGTSGGYSTVPKIQNAPPTPVIQSPKVQQQIQPLSQEQPNEKKGCGCCVVM